MNIEEIRGYRVHMNELGKACQRFRVEHGYLQSNVAESTGYSVENISAFERGLNDNSKILLWYFIHGMTIDYLVISGVLFK